MQALMILDTALPPGRPVFKHYQRRGMLTLRHVPFSKTCYIGRTSSEGTDSWAFR